MPPLRVQLLKAREEEKLDITPGGVRRNGAVQYDGRNKKTLFMGSSAAPSDDDDDGRRRRRRWRIPIPASFSDLRHSRTKTMSNAGSLLTSDSTARSSFSTSTSDRDSPPASADPLPSVAPPRRPSPAPRPPRSEWKQRGHLPPRKIGTVRDTLTADSSDSESDVAVPARDGAASNDSVHINNGSSVVCATGRPANSSDTSAAGASPASSSPLSLYGGWDGSDCDSEKIIIKSTGSCGRSSGQQRLSAVRRSLEAAFALSSSEYRRNAKADLSVIGDFDGATAAVASDSCSSPDFADMKLEWLGARRRGSRRKKGRETSPGNLLLALHPADTNDATAERCRNPSSDRCRTPSLGLLRCIGSDGGSGFRSCYTLRLPDSNEMLLASLSESGAGGRRVYTFFAGSMSNKGGSRRRSPANGWMMRKQDVGGLENRSVGAIASELQVAAKMVVSTNLQLRSGGGGAIYMVSEFVLFEAAASDAAAPAANTAVRTQSSRLASTISAALLRMNQSAFYMNSGAPESRGMVHSSFRRRSHPELAAVVIHTDMVGGGGSRTGSSMVTMVVPAGRHSMPAGSSGPRTLIERWKSGGSCDCGGWDLGCGIKVLGSDLQGSEGGVGGAAWPEAAAALSLVAENESDAFALRFHSNRVTPLAAFAAAVAALHNEEVLAAPPPPDSDLDDDPVRRLDWNLT